MVLGSSTIDREVKKETDEAMEDEEEDENLPEDGEGKRELFSGLLGNADEGILEKQ